MFRFLSLIDAKREELGWSRKDLAVQIKTSPSFISQLFQGDKLINFTTLAKKLEEMALTTKEFALLSGMLEKTVLAVVNGEGSITPELAVLLANATKIPANYWMNHQKGFDENIETT